MVRVDGDGKPHTLEFFYVPREIIPRDMQNLFKFGAAMLMADQEPSALYPVGSERDLDQMFLLCDSSQDLAFKDYVAQLCRAYYPEGVEPEEVFTLFMRAQVNAFKAEQEREATAFAARAMIGSNPLASRARAIASKNN